jgi:UDP-N-acetylglucosamine 4,6-dehydratase
MALNGKSVLITGGTGSFGRKFVETALREQDLRRLIVFSRDELKQHDMRAQFPDVGDSPMRYFIGDIRDRDRLRRAFHDVDVVVHAAALKQVPACEYNPFEAVRTNIDGTKNVIDAAIDEGVSSVLAISTDKAVNPVNLYGATKLCAEKLVVQGNSYRGGRDLRFSCARYGNVMSSRGSVIPIFQEQRTNGRVTITDPRMTRFWITLEQGVRFVMHCIEVMRGGEIFVPKIPSMSITDLAAALAPGCEVEVIGIRSGEKMHEVLISEDEARHAFELDEMYVIEPATHPWYQEDPWADAKHVPEGFRFSSDANAQWLTPEQLLQLVQT